MNERVNSKEKYPPVIKTVTVTLPVAAAFQLFTAGFGSWWPLASHSLGEEQAESCVLEGRVGGRIYEIQREGQQAAWGTVLDWEPPRRLVFSWHPGRLPDSAQQVEVIFQAMDGGAQVTLTHTGWERLGDQAQAQWENYETGWVYVLSRYAAAAAVIPGR